MATDEFWKFTGNSIAPGCRVMVACFHLLNFSQPCASPVVGDSAFAFEIVIRGRGTSPARMRAHALVTSPESYKVNL